MGWPVTDNPDPEHIWDYPVYRRRECCPRCIVFSTYGGGVMASVMTTKMVLNVQRRLVVIENENVSLLFWHKGYYSCR